MCIPPILALLKIQLLSMDMKMRFIERRMIEKYGQNVFNGIVLCAINVMSWLVMFRGKEINYK